MRSAAQKDVEKPDGIRTPEHGRPKMVEIMSVAETRDASLADFDEARRAFVDELGAAPPESLQYLKPGDDYALGGLAFHVNAVLEHYLGVLDAMVASHFHDTEAIDRPGMFATANARARSGLTPEERSVAVALTEQLHSAVKHRVGAIPVDDFERKVAVRYSAGGEPYPTSPADVIGWLIGHYLEHVPHIRRLLDDWRTAR
jgi:hypothetical protein